MQMTARGIASALRLDETRVPLTWSWRGDSGRHGPITRGRGEPRRRVGERRAKQPDRTATNLSQNPSLPTPGASTYVISGILSASPSSCLRLLTNRLFRYHHLLEHVVLVPKGAIPLVR